MYLVDGTVKTVWIRQVFDYSGFGSDRFNCILGGWVQNCKCANVNNEKQLQKLKQ